MQLAVLWKTNPAPRLETVAAPVQQRHQPWFPRTGHDLLRMLLGFLLRCTIAQRILEGHKGLKL